MSFKIDPAGKAKIGVNLNPSYFGRGLGNKIIKAGSEAFLKANPSVKVISAEVIDGNTASRKAFIKAGYVLGDRVIRDDLGVLIFNFTGV